MSANRRRAAPPLLALAADLEAAARAALSLEIVVHVRGLA